METEGSLPYSQEPVTGSYPEPQMNPVHNFPSDLPKIYSNIILPSTPRSSEWSVAALTQIQKQNMMHVPWQLNSTALASESYLKRMKNISLRKYKVRQT
jgi:hypothetical protein